jgi:hypothetical protein
MYRRKSLALLFDTLWKIRDWVDIVKVIEDEPLSSCYNHVEPTFLISCLTSSEELTL